MQIWEINPTNFGAIPHWDQLVNETYIKEIKKIQNFKFNIQKEFNLYLNQGTRPYFLEGDSIQKTINVVDKTLYNDIPYFVPEIKERHLHLMKNVIGHLVLSPIPTLNIDSLSKEWAVAKATVYNLLEVMEKSGLIQIIPEEGKTAKTKGKKIFLADPNIYHCYGGGFGNTREAFFSMVFNQLLRKKVTCPKDDAKADFIVDNVSFEVGGKNKKKKSADFVIRDNIDTPSKGVIPLWVLGLLVK